MTGDVHGPDARAATLRRAAQDALLARLAGSKVTLSTKDLHYVVGHLVEVTDQDVALRVGRRTVRVRRGGIARVLQADPALAEYVK